MIKSLLPRTLIALSLVATPAISAAQTSDPAPQEPAEESTGEPADPDTAQQEADSDAQKASEDQESEENQEPSDQEKEQAADKPDADTEESADQQPTADEVDKPAATSTEPPTAPEKPAPTAKPKTETSDQKESGGDDKKKGGSPISDLADSSDSEGFEPVEDIDEESLQEVTPAEVYPYLEWHGQFRVRSDADVNFDLGTRGTSAILPPLENDLPSGQDTPAANPDSELLWSADTAMRLEPTFHITETLRLHVEAGLLNNVVFGSLSDRRLLNSNVDGTLRPDPSRTVWDANQLSPREREWFEDAIRINEAYGEIDTFLGDVRAGRMDNHWGLGMHANDGDCADCDYGDHVDRIRFETQPFDVYVSAAIDFPDQGKTTQSPLRVDGQPYDMTQIDDARQYTFEVFRSAQTEKELKLQEQRLKEDRLPVFNGGARFTYRSQKGVFNRSADGSSFAESPGQTSQDTRALVYRGLNLYVPDVWFQFRYEPDPKTKIRVELEGIGIFGDVDNATNNPVGQGTNGEDPINCFDDATREANPERCSTTTDTDGNENSSSKGISELGLALESEFYLGGPVRFGLNAGYASGGDSPNWGYRAANGNDLDFFRFDPNYHVDLILFREVIGTVTNAMYANPFVQARFFESPDQRMEVQLDAIASAVANPSGAPHGEDRGLGVELDGAVRYLQIGRFEAGIEGGVLFPLGALDARLGRPRLTQPIGTPEQEFGGETDASIAWTVQGNLNWTF